MPMEKCFECGAELFFDPVTDTLICPVCEPALKEERKLLEAKREEEEREILEEAF